MRFNGMSIVSAVYDAANNNGNMFEVSCSIVDITPKLASDLLEKSNEAKKAKGISLSGAKKDREDKTQRKYAQIMKDDEWKLNGEAIIISEEGIILSGNVRLRACKMLEGNDISFRTFLVKNVSYDAILSVSDRVKRTARDTAYCSLMQQNDGEDISKEQEKEYRRGNYTSIMAWALKCRKGVWTPKKDTEISGSQIGLTTSYYFDRLRQILNMIKEFDNDSGYSRRKKSHNIPETARAGLLFLLSCVDEEIAQMFMNAISFSDAPDSDLFTTFLNLIDNPRAGSNLRKEYQTFGKLLSAWNEYYIWKTEYGNNRDMIPKFNKLAQSHLIDRDIPIIGWPSGMEIEVKAHEKVKRSEINGEYKYAVITITPEMAADGLRANTLNRPIRKNAVLKILRSIETNNWDINGQSIKFGVGENNRPVLLDAQHRLSAIVKAQKSVKALVIVNLDLAIFSDIDIGSHEKSLKSLLNDSGYAMPDKLSAATTLVYNTIAGKGMSNLRSLRELRDFCVAIQLPESRDEISGVFSQNKNNIVLDSVLLSYYAIARKDEKGDAIPVSINNPQRNFMLLSASLSGYYDRRMSKNVEINTDTSWFSKKQGEVRHDKLPWCQVLSAIASIKQRSKQNTSDVVSSRRDFCHIPVINIMLEGWAYYRDGKTIPSAKKLLENQTTLFEFPLFIKDQLPQKSTR